jgi:hypothetical protein
LLDEVFPVAVLLHFMYVHNASYEVSLTLT